MSFIDSIKEKAKKEIKSIVLPESNDIRVLKGAEKAIKENYANIVLVGDENEIQKLAKDNDIDISKAKIVNPRTSEKYEEYANLFYELRKNKGMTLEKAKETVLNEVYFGMMMVKSGDADGSTIININFRIFCSIFCIL